METKNPTVLRDFSADEKKKVRPKKDTERRRRIVTQLRQSAQNQSGLPERPQPPKKKVCVRDVSQDGICRNPSKDFLKNESNPFMPEYFM